MIWTNKKVIKLIWFWLYLLMVTKIMFFYFCSLPIAILSGFWVAAISLPIVSYNSIVGCFHCGDTVVLLLVLLCAYVLCTLAGSWVATSHEFFATPKQVLSIGDGWVNLLKKEDLWRKSFYLLMQNEVIKIVKYFVNK